LETTAKLTTGDGEFAMHITIDEAIAILDSWKTGETLLDVHASIAGHGRKFQASVISVRGVVSLSGSEGETEVDLAGATFNGDRRASPNSHYGACLICEYGNGDVWSFYAPRRLGIESGIPSIERRRAATAGRR
jgi:hypothetical protein